MPEIARAYLDQEATVAQRIVRAKKTIAAAGVPFEVPVGEDRVARLGAVLEVIYLIYNEGYSATAGSTWVRPELCAEALRLGRVLASLAPDEPEVHGLVALMEFQSSRLRARIGSSGAPVLLFDQDRRSWDPLHINRGEAALARAEALVVGFGAVGGGGGVRGPYVLQAAIASCHVRSFRPEDTDWARLVSLYSDWREPRGVTGGGAEPGGGAVLRVRSGGGPALRRPDRRERGARALPPALQRAGRPARSARPLRRGGRGVGAGGRAGGELGRAGAVGGPGGGEPDAGGSGRCKGVSL